MAANPGEDQGLGYDEKVLNKNISARNLSWKFSGHHTLLPSSKVFTMFPSLRVRGFNYLQAVADANNLSMDRIKVIGRKSSSLTMNDLNHEKVKTVEVRYLSSAFNSKIHTIVFLNHE
jgi:hypothetical protein